MEILMKSLHGSRLYGLHNENSDTDYKCVYLPTLRDCVMDEIVHTINESPEGQNTKDDTDTTYYSLQNFLYLALQGSPVAIEMLHAEGDSLISTSPIWDFIQSKRQEFYTDNISNMMEFAESQAKKYTTKISKYNELCKLRESLLVLIDENKKVRIAHVENRLPISEISFFTEDELNGKQCKFYNIENKRFVNNMFLKDVMVSVDASIKRYGKRVIDNSELAKDGKALSHAARAITQMIEILKYGDFAYPLPNTKLLMAIKLGELSAEEVEQHLTNLTEKVTMLRAKTKLPSEPDKQYWEDFILKIYLDRCQYEK